MSLPTASSPAAAGDHDPTRLIILLFVAGTLLAIAVGYLGNSNLLGGSIPGTYAGHGGTTPACEGSNKTGEYHFLLIAGEKGSISYNGSTPGPCLEVGIGSAVVVTLRVDPASGNNHGWDLIPSSGPVNVSPVFPGAGLTGSARWTGIAPGTEQNFSFNATIAGTYRYVCEVDDHASLGMNGTFTVAPQAENSVARSGISAPPLGSSAPAFMARSSVQYMARSTPGA
jgi:hypothetical protein